MRLRRISVRLWRSKLVMKLAILGAIGCFMGLTLLSFGMMRASAYSLPTEAATPVMAQAVPAPAATPTSPDLDTPFQELGLDGSILIYDAATDRIYQHNPARNATPFFPGSTFKIFNAMVALETGVIPDDVAVLTWDGISRGLDPENPIAAWNQDTNLRQAFKNSTVWFYQVLARKAGPEQMQQWIDRVGYGNQQIGAVETIDHFWLDGPLQITAQQQIEFLQRLYRGDLPFSERSMNLVKDMMVLEQTPQYTLRGKTGWTTSTTPQNGWIVGYLEQNQTPYFFATNVDMRSSDDAPLRLEVTRRCLQALGLL
jgi:beta-lactamase class D